MDTPNRLTISQYDHAERRSVEIASGTYFIVTDGLGNAWRISPRSDGPGLNVVLAESSTGDSGLSVEPQASNHILVKPRGA